MTEVLYVVDAENELVSDQGFHGLVPDRILVLKQRWPGCVFDLGIDVVIRCDGAGNEGVIAARDEATKLVVAAGAISSGAWTVKFSGPALVELTDEARKAK